MAEIVAFFIGQPWYLNGFANYLGPHELVLYHMMVWMACSIPVLLIFGFFAIYKLNFMVFVIRLELAMLILIVVLGALILPLINHNKDYHFKTGVVKTYTIKSMVQPPVYVAQVFRYDSHRKLIYQKTSQAKRPLVPNAESIY